MLNVLIPASSGNDICQKAVWLVKLLILVKLGRHYFKLELIKTMESGSVSVGQPIVYS